MSDYNLSLAILFLIFTGAAALAAAFLPRIPFRNFCEILYKIKWHLYPDSSKCAFPASENSVSSGNVSSAAGVSGHADLIQDRHAGNINQADCSADNKNGCLTEDYAESAARIISDCPISGKYVLRDYSEAAPLIFPVTAMFALVFIAGTAFAPLSSVSVLKAAVSFVFTALMTAAAVAVVWESLRDAEWK